MMMMLSPRFWLSLWSLLWLLLLLDAALPSVQAFTTSTARRRATKRNNHASPVDFVPEQVVRHVDTDHDINDDMNSTPLYDPPLVVSPQDPPPVPRFTSWDNLLATTHTTRSNKPLHAIPRFVDFMSSHKYHAERYYSSGSGSGKGEIKQITVHPTHVPNLLQGGAATGPIARTVAGQVVRVLGYYLDLKARPRHGLPSQHGQLQDGQLQHGPLQQDLDFGFRHDNLEWVHELQAQLTIIQQELRRVLADAANNDDDDDDDTNASNNLDARWKSLRTHRGPEWSDRTGWSHIALVDNFRVQPNNIDLFPETAQLLQRIVGTERRIGPRLVAIAKQEADSGIPEHCDYMNWMLTLHTALDGPERGCGITVHGVKRDWTVGDPVVMDTTYLHETYNTSNQTMYLLLLDFWHPDLSIDEIDALRTFFATNSGL